LYKKALAGLIIIGILTRCIVAGTIEFGNDEVYYWTYSQHLQWNYFDHPPMVALLIRLTTFDLSLQQLELFVRLGAIICAALATYFLYKAVLNISDEKAAFLVALLYNASLYGSIITGVFILPDSPQMFFWTASLFILSKTLVSEKAVTAHWVLFGILTGLTIMSKIHGVFIWAGLLLYILVHRRKWLGLWQLYLSFFICLLITSPILLWNLQNNFATYQYHSSRLEGITFKGDNFAREIFGEIFYNNPINFVLTFMALTWFFRHGKTIKNHFLTVCLFIAIPMIILLLMLAMFNDTLPHWTGPAYITLLPIAAVYLSLKRKIQNNIPRIVQFSLAFTLFVITLGVLSVNFYPGTLGKQNSVSKFGEGDVTLDMYGWKAASEKIDSLVTVDAQKGIMPRDAQFVCNKWYPAAHIDYYIARPLHKFVIGIGAMNDLHHYEWLNEFRLRGQTFQDAYCVFPSDYRCDVKKVYAGIFASIDSVETFPVYRNSKVCKYFSVYRLKNLEGEIPRVK